MTKKEFNFFRPPASGKGTQTTHLAEYLNLPHVDTGALLRAAIASGSEDGLTAKKFIDDGKLVPVDLVASIIKTRLSEDDCRNGYILDGFPRSVEQAEKLEIINRSIDNDKVDFKAIYFDIDTEVLIDRIIYRRSCPKCGEIYNLKFNPPKSDSVCDKCGEKLTQRKDDNRETAQKRFETYFAETAPLIDYYKNKGALVSIDANGDIEQVWDKLLKVIND